MVNPGVYVGERRKVWAGRNDGFSMDYTSAKHSFLSQSAGL